MFDITGVSIDELYSVCLEVVLKYGDETHPRGFNCLELSLCSITLINVQNNILVNHIRNAKQAFMGAELLWILMGREDVDMISFYNSKIIPYSDDGVKFFGAYGPKVISQLRYVVECLQQDQWTRQAIIGIWRECPPITKDIPCTIMMHFLRRPINTLNLVVYMRSQDLWLGFPYDVHNFTCIQLIIASILGCKPGTFTLIQGSLHLYEQDYEKAKQASSFRTNIVNKTPLSTIFSLEEFDYQMTAIRSQDAVIRRNQAPGPYLNRHEILNQKMGWLYDFAKEKHEKEIKK